MAAATICTSAFAQSRAKYIYTSTTTLNLEVLQNSEQPVVLNRTLFAGYNTICLPMSLSAEQLKAAAKDVQIERLETIRQEGNTLNMYFLDCTNEGIEAGVPYLIFSPTFQTLHANTQEASGISTELQSITKTDGAGNTITFGSSWDMLKVEGRYGIPAQQDTYLLESILIRTDGDMGSAEQRRYGSRNQARHQPRRHRDKHRQAAGNQCHCRCLQRTGHTGSLANHCQRSQEQPASGHLCRQGTEVRS